MQRGHIMVQLARQKLGFGLKEDANENSDEWVSNSVISSEDDGGPITSMFRLAKQHGVKGNANKENSAALVTNTMESQGDRGRQLRYLRQENKALRQYIKISTNPLNCFPCSSLLSSNDCSSQETAVLGKAIPDSAVPSLTSRNNTSDVESHAAPVAPPPPIFFASRRRRVVDIGAPPPPPPTTTEHESAASAVLRCC